MSTKAAVVQANRRGLGRDGHVGFMAVVCAVVGAWERSLEVKARNVALDTTMGLIPS